MNIITRKEAKEQGLTRYFTGNPCPKNHVDERYTYTGQCCVCVKQKAKKRQAAWREVNREQHRKEVAKYQKENGAKVTAYLKEWKKNNPEKVKLSSKKSRQKNKASRNANTAKRRAARVDRTPNWITDDDLFLIKEAYALAELRTKTTGIEWHVDHIVPLLGSTVSGLHCSENLQVIPAKHNLSKQNSWNWELQQ
jgi:hypothetical protein